MQHKLANVYRLGVKELWSLWRDPMMLLLILYSFSANIYIAGTSMPETLHKAPIAVVDEDQSGLSSRIISAFYLPYFIPPQLISLSEVDAALDAGVYSFVLNIPPAFEQDTLAGRSPKVQLSVDATRISQAFSGSGYIEQIVSSEISEFSQRQRLNSSLPVDLVLRASFNLT